MADEQAGRSHPSGETTGSSERAPQHWVEAIQAFDLAAESAQLRYERGYREGDRNANTLVKAPNVRVALTAMRAGARLEEHRAASAVTVQTIEGRLRLHTGGQRVDLPAGHLLALESGVAHDVEALEDSVFLLTLTRPSGLGDGEG